MEIDSEVNGIPPVLTTWASTVMKPDAPTVMESEGESPAYNAPCYPMPRRKGGEIAKVGLSFYPDGVFSHELCRVM